jgi:hypothetical protein
MTEAGKPVPPGFVLTVTFFEPWIAIPTDLPRMGRDGKIESQ